MQLSDSHRPTELSQIIGHEKPVKVLQNLLQKPRPSAWLLEGPSGIGKTSAALCIGKALAHNCLDLMQVNGQSVTQPEAERLADLLQTPPMNGGFRVVIIDEADRMSENAQLVFLSALEQLGGTRSILILTSNEGHEFEPRFRSRVHCLAFSAHGFSKPAADFLAKVAAANGLVIDPRDALKRIQAARNNLRAALQELETDLMLGEVV